MNTTALHKTVTAVLLAAMLALAGCVGGGAGPQTASHATSSPASGQTGGRTVGQTDHRTPSPESDRTGGDTASPVYSGLRKAAAAIPRLGRRSVTQSSNTDLDNVTTDTVEAVFDRGRLSFSVTRGDGTRIALDSARDTASTNPGTPVRSDRVTGNWRLEKQSSDYTTIVNASGELPDRDFPLRSIRAAGNYGTNMEAVNAWEAAGRSVPLVPNDYIDWLKSLHVTQVGLSVALLYDDSMDSTVERVYAGPNINTFSDDAIRQFIREFREHGIDVYLTLAFESVAADTAERPVLRWQLGDPGDSTTGVPHFGNILPENWPWRPTHPDHARFVAEFWQTYSDQAVHFAQIAEEEGVRLFSLGTETENLFRTRSGGHYWPNHFKQELQSMVDSVREVYSGLLTYDMHYTALTAADHFGTGSDHLWEDLDLDIVGVSAYFEMADTVPSGVISVAEFERRYEKIFQQYLLPLSERNPDRPILFLEYGAIDTVASAASPGNTDFSAFVFQDGDGNGLDDGREMQANMFQALVNTMGRYPGLVNGILWTENWIASDQKWAEHWGNRRGFSVRDKPSEEVVRTTHESWAEWLVGGYWMQVSEDMSVDEAGAYVDAPEFVGTPTLPSLGTASYRGVATGGYALVYGEDFAGVPAGSHEIGDYEGDLELSVDFSAKRIAGRVHSMEADGFHTPRAGQTRPFNDVSMPYEIALEATAFDSSGFTGRTGVTSTDSEHEIANSSGSWGGKFSNLSDLDGNPRLVAGTHGAEFTAAKGAQGSFIGVFAGVTGQISRQRSHDGESASRVAEYLGVHASGGPWQAGPDYSWSHSPGLVRFASPPTVRLADGASERERAITAYAVALINRALPYDQHLIIGADAPAGVAGQWEQGLPNIPDGQLFVEFIQALPQGGRPGSEALAHQAVESEYDADQGRWEKKRLRASSVEMNSEFFRGRPDHQAVSVLAHEMLHSLGLQGHVNAPAFEDSNMYNAWIRLDGSLPAIDAAGLQALYTRLGEETEPEDLSASSLGAWSREIVHLSDELHDIAFGVRHSNGVSMPWTAGTEPSSTLQDNNSLSGTATWNGALLGFTPALDVVGGDAELSVKLDTMDGRAEFTELQSWAAGTTLGTLGTGAQWNSGSLGYTITVAGNYLRSTGGDDGTVNGQFYGAGHEGVAGSLEREDLTAAFGATRN